MIFLRLIDELTLSLFFLQRVGLSTLVPGAPPP
jgi:hypothetical protein